MMPNDYCSRKDQGRKAVWIPSNVYTERGKYGKHTIKSIES